MTAGETVFQLPSVELVVADLINYLNGELVRPYVLEPLDFPGKYSSTQVVKYRDYKDRYGLTIKVHPRGIRPCTINGVMISLVTCEGQEARVRSLYRGQRTFPHLRDEKYILRVFLDT